MNIARRLFVVAVLVIAGCSSLPGTYADVPFSKSPLVLTLQRDGRYSLERKYSNSHVERGQWWDITRDVVVLLPDARTQVEHFARVDRRGLSQLRITEDLRSALEPPPPDTTRQR